MIFFRYIIFLFFNIFIFLENKSTDILEKNLDNHFKYIAQAYVYKNYSVINIEQEFLSKFIKKKSINKIKKIANIPDTEKAKDEKADDIFKIIKENYNKIKIKASYCIELGKELKLKVNNGKNVNLDSKVYSEYDEQLIKKYFEENNEKQQLFTNLIFYKLIPIKNINNIFFHNDFLAQNPT